ncbi:winged helix-turn-helix domain-containing protein [Natrarchaeobius sp. A-rgal3]|uniref:winged helix-turn-helix domain-containing protein n=1 Tax=Natrarchaeobius versutus TaxID=1679078 RepID=UPI00350F8DA8
MRQSGTWMTIWDDRILEIIRDEGAKPVGELAKADAVRISHSSVSRRCQKLADHGLLLPIGNGVYDITDEGEAYLDEEYDAENEVYLTDSDSVNPSVPTETTET